MIFLAPTPQTPVDVSMMLDSGTVLNGFFATITTNIVPILTLMGVMLGVRWVVRKFGAAKNARI